MLTDHAIRSLAPKPALYRASDRDGLCLEVTPGGKKHWRFRYQWAGHARMISLGTYPIVTLAQARQRCFDARRDLSDGRDPAQVKRDKKDALGQREENKFPAVARRWLQARHFEPAQRTSDNKPFAQKTYRKASTIIESDLIPSLRHVPVADLSTPQAIAALDKIQARAPNMAIKATGPHDQRRLSLSFSKFTESKKGKLYFDPDSTIKLNRVLKLVLSNYSKLMEKQIYWPTWPAIRRERATYVCYTRVA